uniref:C-glycosyltransferase n=1 Tax=Bergenia purpurascens TaxID=482967 RepID=A0AA50NZI7_9MAGN|nr:C-glycosyltransferase [Bergenia purpurascens]
MFRAKAERYQLARFFLWIGFNISDFQRSPHIALFPSAGMGHLTPFLRLAAMLSSRNCLITLITAKPTVSAAESTHISSFISTHPEIRHLEFQILPINATNPTTDDPFFIQFEAVSRSVHVLHPLLSSASPPLCAIFSDLVVASSTAPIADDLCIPNYIVSTTSAKFLCLIAYLPVLTSDSAKFNLGCTEVQIPGLSPLPITSIPPPFWNTNHLFTAHLITNARALPKAKGIIMNTFNWFEQETIDAVSNGGVLDSLPPILPIGPLKPFSFEKDQNQYLSWLDNQPAESVVYVSFGSRTAMSEDQIRELGIGLERSKHRFLWVLKSSKVDKEDSKDLKELLGNFFLERTSNQGIIVKRWVNQEEILAHPAIGGFINHCGWNSVSEAAWQGIPILAWPQHGDQRVNAGVVEKVGLGIWERGWGWGGEKLVKGVEIGERIGQLMEDEKLRSRARKVGEEAKKACGFGGSSEKALTGIIDMVTRN